MDTEKDANLSLAKDIEGILADVLSGAQSRILGELIDKKLSATGQTIPPDAKAALIQHILGGGEDGFSWSDENGGDVTASVSLSFDEADVAEIDAMQARVARDVPAAIFGELDRQAGRLFKSLKAKWKKEAALQAQDVAIFESRLYKRWGKGIELLRILLTISREIGRETLNLHQKAASDEVEVKIMLLVRLHARACQVAEEIICLMESGLAEGAMARWRTLHEISVVSALIADGDQELAERFTLHKAIEEWDQLEQYRRDWPNNLYSKAEILRQDELKIECDALIKKYGKSYSGLYGWASGYLNNKKPTFRDLQNGADRATERSVYKFASFNVHAGASGTFNRLSGMGPSKRLLAGRSNAGLAQPGRNTAFSLVQITGTLVGAPRTFDDFMIIKTLLAVRDAIPRALDRAEHKLWRDEAAWVKKNE